jgi:hypothetical protein
LKKVKETFTGIFKGNQNKGNYDEKIISPIEKKFPGD